MTITVLRSGGVAGSTRGWVVVVEEQPDRESWLKLLESVPWDRRPPGSAQPDRYVYQIHYSQRRVTLPETELRGVWRELVDRVLRTGTVQGRPDIERREGQD